MHVGGVWDDGSHIAWDGKVLAPHNGSNEAPIVPLISLFGVVAQAFPWGITLLSFGFFNKLLNYLSERERESEMTTENIKVKHDHPNS